jgi:superfamily I DNA/RNA helicase
MLFMEGLARNKQVPLKKVWEDANEDSICWEELDRFARSYAAFKKSRSLMDFTDMLEKFVKTDPSTLPKLDLLLCDEGQDCSSLQWEALELLSQNTKQVYVSGDDVQAVYTWSGANVQKFINLPGHQTTLEQSYRVPSTVHKLADSISDRIQNKRPRVWRPRPEKGAVNWYGNFDEVDLSKGTWLILARNGYMLTELEDYCLSQGFSFRSVGRDPLKSYALSAIRTWESLRRGNNEAAEKVLDCLKYLPAQLVPMSLLKKLKAEEAAQMFCLSELTQLGLGTTAIWHTCMTKIAPAERDFFIAARKRGEPLLKEPRLRISTIHASKGGQAENVLLMTDMSYRCAQNMESNMDDEARVFYVAVTRCKETLNIVMPRTNMAFAI